MIRLAHWRVALELILGFALLASLGIVLHQSRRLADCRRQQSANLESLRRLTDTLHQHALEQVPGVAGEPAAEVDCRTVIATRDATLKQLNLELSDARSQTSELRTQLADSSDERVKALASEGQRYQKAQADWEDRLAAVQQQLDAAESQSEASRLRIAALEADNAKLRSSSSEASTRAAELGRVLVSEQDLVRRRDAYLTSIIRRYRDLNGEFRAMSGMLDSSRDSNSNAFSSQALTRVQNTVSQTEDDLRQLNDLNEQIRQLEAKLAKK
jgi:chromosome segregation ATPase